MSATASAVPTTRALVRRWSLRALGIAAVLVVLLVVLIWLDFDPDPVRLALVVSIAFLAFWTLVDALLEPAPPWWVHRHNQVTPVGADQRLGRYAGMVEDHLASQHPSEAVRLQLCRLATASLWQHHRVALGDTAADSLLGERVAQLLREPGHHFTLPELQQVLDAVERVGTVAPSGRKEPDAPAAPAR